MNKRDAVLVGLCIIAIIILASTLLLLDPAIHARFLEVVDTIGHGIVLLFVVGLTLASAAAGVKIWKMFSTHVVKDGKDGQIARAIVYKGMVVQIGSAEGIGLNEILAMQAQLIGQQQKTLQVVDSGAKAIHRMLPLLSEYGEDEEEEDDTLQIEGPKIYNLSDQIRSGQTVMDEESSVVGYVDEQPLEGKLFANDGNMFDSVFIIGDTGFGKSTAAVYMAALTIYHGGRLIVIDPDAEFDQSLTARLGPLANDMFLLCPIADTPEKAEQAVRVARYELESPGDYPVLWLIDEFSMIMRQATGGTGKWSEVGKSMTDLTEDWATRGRKRRRRVEALGQIPNAKRSGGTEFRDSATVLSFHMKKARAQMVLDKEEAAIASDLGMGEVIVIPARSSEASYRMQLPYPDSDGLRIIADTMVKMASRDGSEYGSGYHGVEPELDLNHSRTRLEPLPEPIKISPELAFKAKVRRVRELRRQNKNQSQIIETLYGVSKGGSTEYAKARDEYVSIMQIIAAEDAQAQEGF